MSCNFVEKLAPILKSDLKIAHEEVSNIFELIDNRKLAKLDSKQLKSLLFQSEIPRVFAEAILNAHYSKRKLFYKQSRREQEFAETEEIGASIGVLRELRSCYLTEKQQLESEILYYQQQMKM